MVDELLKLPIVNDKPLRTSSHIVAAMAAYVYSLNCTAIFVRFMQTPEIAHYCWQDKATS